jgi:protein subunit release factor A
MQDERSQHKNRAKAMSILRSRLYQAQRDKQEKERSAMRLSQVGSAARSDKVRTYNFAANRIKDHRIGLAVFGMYVCRWFRLVRLLRSHSPDRDEMINGQKLDMFIDALALAQRINALAALTQTDNGKAAANARK